MLVSLTMFNFKRSSAAAFAVPFRLLKRKKCDSVVSELVPLFQATPIKQDLGILVPLDLRCSFQDFRLAPPSFLYGTPHPSCWTVAYFPQHVVKRCRSPTVWLNDCTWSLSGIALNAKQVTNISAFIREIKSFGACVSKFHNECLIPKLKDLLEKALSLIAYDT